MRGYDGSTKLRKLAKVDIRIGSSVLKNHRVALVSERELSGKGLLATKPGDETWKLMSDHVLDGTKSLSVSAVKTRTMVKQKEREDIAEAEQLLLDQPDPRGLCDEGVVLEEVCDGNLADGRLSSVLDEDDGEESLVLDEEDECSVSDSNCESDCEDLLDGHSSDPTDEVTSLHNSENLDIPIVCRGSSANTLSEEVHADQSLKIPRQLADKGERGYSWRDGLLLHTITDIIEGVCERIVIPRCRRREILTIAHDKLGHLGSRKVVRILKKRFTWPCMSREVHEFVSSCDLCQRNNRTGHKRAPMIERPIITEPFETVAFDLVGPFSKARHSKRYLLTYCCMATRWPDAVALSSITAHAVADGMIKIFSRTGLPLVMLTDQGCLWPFLIKCTSGLYILNVLQAFIFQMYFRSLYFKCASDLYLPHVFLKPYYQMCLRPIAAY